MMDVEAQLKLLFDDAKVWNDSGDALERIRDDVARAAVDPWTFSNEEDRAGFILAYNDVAVPECRRYMQGAIGTFHDIATNLRHAADRYHRTDERSGRRMRGAGS
jgi:hypothetical protein